MRFVFACAIATILCALASEASAGAFIDDMSKCLVAKSTPEDQTVFMEWMFSLIARHPAVRPLSNISDSQRNELTSKAGQLMMRLVTVDCREQTVAALKYEGASAFGNAFQLLGGAAMEGLMKDPSVDQGLEGLKNSIDDAKLKNLFAEAGLPVKDTK